MRAAVRIAALAELPVSYIWTHDSIGVGEDGPTHQPVETVSGLRAFPNLDVFRPADYEETAGAYVGAAVRTNGRPPSSSRARTSTRPARRPARTRSRAATSPSRSPAT